MGNKAFADMFLILKIDINIDNKRCCFYESMT